MQSNKKNNQPRAKKLRRLKPILGWREWVSLPGLSIAKLRVKVDTGARTSALHAKGIQFVKAKHGKKMVSFIVISDDKSRVDEAHRIEAELLEIRKVKSSDGKSTMRPVIRTDILVGNQFFSIEITLVDRSMMGYRMLLGRKAVKRRFFVDPSRSYLGLKMTNTQS